MIFKTYTKQGQILLDSQTPVFALIKTVTPTRLLTPPFDQNKRELWYRAKRLGVNSKMRQRWVDIHTKEYCMYYADVPSVMTPITTISYDGMAHECEPIVFLNAGQFDGKTRLMFYSNGRLSDGQLANYRIHVFDTNVQRQTQVGINLYDKKGNVTFSNHSRLLNMDTLTIHNHRPFMSAKEAKELIDLRKIVNRGRVDSDFNFERLNSLEEKFEQWHQKMKQMIRDRSTEDEFVKNGFIKVNNGYLNTRIKGVAGFGSVDLMLVNYIELRVGYGSTLLYELSMLENPKFSSYTKTYKMACIGCRDGLFVCPTLLTFNDVLEDGNKRPINIIHGITKNHAIHVRYTHI